MTKDLTARKDGYTPGPWEAEGCYVRAKSGVVVATSAIRTPQEERANAILCAAAPDLLAACEAIVCAFVRHPGNQDERAHALIIAQSAIKKARNE